MSQMVLSALIFVAAYILIIWDKFDRTVIALAGAVLMVLTGILPQEKAFEKIEYNTIALLVGMMIMVIITKRSGIFEYLAVKTVKLVKGEPVKIIIMLSLVTGLLSAVLDNVTTILLVIPVTLSIAKDLHINPVPFIISEVFASNVGGTATLIGDPPNIMIGSSVGLTFMDFLKNTGAIAIILLLLCTYIMVLIYKKKLLTTDEARLKIMQTDESKLIKDKKLLIKSVCVLSLTIILFMLHGITGLESSTIAIGGAVLLLLISNIRPEKVLHEIEWKTILFFIGLFVMVGGIEESGLIKELAKGMLDITNGNLTLTVLCILWVSAIASAFIDNIPFVTTMIPLIKDMGAMSGMNLGPVWWALSLGACLGGNGTLIGASANVVAAGIADEHGHKISFKQYFKVSFPVMLVSVAVSCVYLIIFYL